MPECSRMPLMKTKSGTAMNEKLDAFDHAIEPTTPRPDVKPFSQSRPTTPTMPSAREISTPSAKSRNISADEQRADERLAHAWSSGATSSRDDGGPSRICTCRTSAATMTSAMSARPAGISSIGSQSG